MTSAALGSSSEPLACPRSETLVFDPAREGFEAAFTSYRALYAAGADTEAASPRFYAAVQARALRRAVLFERTLFDVIHRRGEARVRRDRFDHVTLQYVREGKMALDCGGARRRLSSGDLALVDMTQPFASLSRGRMVTLSLSRELLRDAGLATRRLHGVTFKRVSTPAPLARSLQALVADPYETNASERLVEHLRAAIDDFCATPADREAQRREQAMRLIDRRLGATDLTPAEIARAIGVSRATLFRAFEPLGGVSAWVQQRRLTTARIVLATTDLPTADAAIVAGFANASHLTTAFRRRWGTTPSAYRRSRLAEHPGTATAALRDIGVALACDDAFARDVRPPQPRD